MSKLDFSNNKKSISTKMTLNNSHKLLTGFLALVLVAGMTSPAFAALNTDLEEATSVTTTEPVRALLVAEENVIFDGGTADFNQRCELSISSICADDFVLETDSVLTDVHLDVAQSEPGFTAEFVYFIYEDDSGVPGALIQSGDGVNESKDAIDDEGNFRYWIDLDNPLPLEGGVTYWIALQTPDALLDSMFWWTTTPGFDNPLAIMFEPDVWTPNIFHLNFALTGDQNIPIGGTSFPVSTTTLLVAGAQANMGLLSLALVGMVAAGAAITYKVKSKKTEQ